MEALQLIVNRSPNHAGRTTPASIGFSPIPMPLGDENFQETQEKIYKPSRRRD
jgi:hypothetical protein